MHCARLAYLTLIEVATSDDFRVRDVFAGYGLDNVAQDGHGNEEPRNVVEHQRYRRLMGVLEGGPHLFLNVYSQQVFIALQTIPVAVQLLRTPSFFLSRSASQLVQASVSF